MYYIKVVKSFFDKNIHFLRSPLKFNSGCQFHPTLSTELNSWSPTYNCCYMNSFSFVAK